MNIADHSVRKLKTTRTTQPQQMASLQAESTVLSPHGNDNVKKFMLSNSTLNIR